MPFHAWMRGKVHEVFKSPLYRALFTLLPPSLLARRIGRRWETLRRGSSFQNVDHEVSAGRRTYTMRLCMPPKLFPAFILESNARRLEATMEVARNPRSARRPARILRHRSALRSVLENRLGPCKGPS